MPTTAEPIDNYMPLKVAGAKRNQSLDEFDVVLPSEQHYYLYLLFDKDELVYVGKTKYKDRLAAHRRTKIFDSVYYGFTTLWIDGGFYDPEAEIIRLYKTRYNRCKKAKKHHPELNEPNAKLLEAKAELARHEKQVERLKQQITLLESNQQLN